MKTLKNKKKIEKTLKNFRNKKKIEQKLKKISKIRKNMITIKWDDGAGGIKGPSKEIIDLKRIKRN